ncbi:hypothetical protein [Streptomyces sp. HPF1205]|uniref:hypothetical protein n=1 Tax=Streptomyces sp. HPF1205 TaxID=2873262 RepID=UPI001CED33B2|nr:hypothetical protein [Streptomyces sp. HPF1205]
MHVWKDLDTTVAGRLASASDGERAVFCAAVAQRLMLAHEALPAEERRQFTLGLRPLLEAVWAGALGDASAFDAIKRGLGTYYLGPYCHNEGPDGPDDADEHAAAAVLHAAEAYMHGCGDFALFVSGHAVEAATDLLPLDDDFADDPEEARAEELRRQLRDLDLIATEAQTLRRARFGLTTATTARLQEALRPLLSRPDDLP